MLEEIKKERIINIPNILSVLRVLMVPLFAFYYFSKQENNFVIAVIIILVSGLTDIADGVIARKFNMITTVGKILDPIADKLTQGTIVACIAIRHTFLVPLLILFCAKEFSMLLGAVRLFKIGMRPSESKWWGKLSTCITYLMFVLVLVSDIFPEFPVEFVYISAVIAAICLVFSLFNYYPIFKEIQNGEYDMEKEKNTTQPKGKK